MLRGSCKVKSEECIGETNCLLQLAESKFDGMFLFGRKAVEAFCQQLEFVKQNGRLYFGA